MGLDLVRAAGFDGDRPDLVKDSIDDADGAGTVSPSLSIFLSLSPSLFPLPFCRSGAGWSRTDDGDDEQTLGTDTREDDCSGKPVDDDT